MTIKTRTILVGNVTYIVPERVQRLKPSKGWQTRYVINQKMTTKFFSDGTAGAGVSLDVALDYLVKCIREHGSSYSVGSTPYVGKKGNLPSGISGPIRRKKSLRIKTETKSYVWEYSLRLPRYGHGTKCRTVYIASDNALTQEKKAVALAKAVALRNAAEDAWNRAAHIAKQAEIPEILKLKRQAL